MIYINDVRKLINQQQPFNMKVYKLDGELVTAKNVVCTSTFHKANSFNVKHIDSGQIRNYRVHLIIEFNNQEVYL